MRLKSKIKMYRFLFLFISLNPCQQNQFQVAIFKNIDNTYGYDILKDSKILIHQPSKPGHEGNAGFLKKQSARSVAKLVIYKLEHNIIPPSINKFEIDSLLAY